MCIAKHTKILHREVRPDKWTHLRGEKNIEIEYSVVRIMQAFPTFGHRMLTDEEYRYDAYITMGIRDTFLYYWGDICFDKHVDDFGIMYVLKRQFQMEKLSRHCYAAAFGQLETVQWFVNTYLDHQSEKLQKACIISCLGASIDLNNYYVIPYLLYEAYVVRKDTLDLGHDDDIYKEHDFYVTFDYMCQFAVENDNLKCFHILVSFFGESKFDFKTLVKHCLGEEFFECALNFLRAFNWHCASSSVFWAAIDQCSELDTEDVHEDLASFIKELIISPYFKPYLSKTYKKCGKECPLGIIRLLYSKTERDASVDQTVLNDAKDRPEIVEWLRKAIGKSKKGQKRKLNIK